jgi:hypothetical protein
VIDKIMESPFEFELRFPTECSDYEKKALMDIVESYVEECGSSFLDIFGQTFVLIKIKRKHKPEARGIRYLEDFGDGWGIQRN